jgi:hypothetical protein
LKHECRHRVACCFAYESLRSLTAHAHARACMQVGKRSSLLRTRLRKVYFFLSLQNCASLSYVQRQTLIEDWTSNTFRVALGHIDGAYLSGVLVQPVDPREVSRLTRLLASQTCNFLMFHERFLKRFNVQFVLFNTLPCNTPDRQWLVLTACTL